MQLEVLASLGPGGIARELAALERLPLARAAQWELPHLDLPEHHDVRSSDVVVRRLHGNLAAAAERGPTDFSDLLLTPGVGARTVRAVAMVAEVVHGTPYRFTDPARFSFAHGGKDRHASVAVVAFQLFETVGDVMVVVHCDGLAEGM
jgi:hypothetical protein